MSTLNALAQKHGIATPLRVSDCPKALTIIKIEEQMMPDGQGGRVKVDVLIAKADNGTLYTVRLNKVLVTQLIRIFGADAEIENRRILADTFVKGDMSFISFAQPPAANAPKKPKFLPGEGNGTTPTKDNKQFALNPEAQAAIAALERTCKN